MTDQPDNLGHQVFVDADGVPSAVVNMDFVTDNGAHLALTLGAVCDDIKMVQWIVGTTLQKHGAETFAMIAASALCVTNQHLLAPAFAEVKEATGRDLRARSQALADGADPGAGNAAALMPSASVDNADVANMLSMFFGGPDAWSRSSAPGGMNDAQKAEFRSRIEAIAELRRQPVAEVLKDSYVQLMGSVVHSMVDAEVTRWSKWAQHSGRLDLLSPLSTCDAAAALE